MMKGKRLLSLILTVCLLLGNIPAFVYAGEPEQTPPAESVVVTYDFALENTELTNTSGQTFAEKSITGTANQGAIAQYYANEDIQWRYAADNVSDFGSGYISVSYFGGDDNKGNPYPWAGLRLGVKNEADNSCPTGHWTAFTIRVPQTGKYDLMLNHQLRGDATPTGEIYLLPGVYADEAAINEALTTENLQKIVDFTKSNNEIEDKQTSLGKATMAKGEYTLVFKATSKRNNNNNLACYIFIKSLVATLDTSSVTDIQEAYYDFRLAATQLTYGNQKSFAGATVSSADVTTALSNYYDANDINWKFAANNLTDGDKDFSYFGGTATFTWDGLRFAAQFNGSYAPGHWTAITVKSPGEGTFNISLDYQIRGDGNLAEKVYLIEGALTDKTAIEEAMTAGNLLGTVNGKTAPDGSTTALSSWNVNLGKRTLSDGEYTLVFHASATTGNYFFASGVKMVEQIQQDSDETTEDTTVGGGETQPSTEPEEPAPIVPMGYDFQIGGSNLTVNGESFGGKTLNSANVLAALKDYYDTGILSWNFNNVNNFDTFKKTDNTISPMYYIGGGSYKWTGVRMGMRITEPEKNPETGEDVYTYPAGVWTAVTVKSPGKGLYDIVLDYQIRADGTPEGEIYLLKGNITDQKAINKALKEENLLKKVNFSSKSFDMADRTAILATKQLEAGEYTLVFHAASSGSGNFFYINQLQFNKTQPKPAKKPLQVNKLELDFTAGQKLVDLNGDLFAGQRLDDSDVIEAMEQYYEGRKISWKYALDNYATFQKSDNMIYSMDYIGGTEQYKWAGLRLGIKVSGPEKDDKGELVNKYPEGHWTAFTVESPGKGLYEIILDYQIRADGTPDGEIYLLKGKITDQKAINKALTEKNLLKTVNFSSKTFDMADRTTTLSIKELEQGEYTLVFRAASKGTGNFFYINGLQFKKTQPKPPKQPLQVKKLVYDFTAGKKLKDLNNNAFAGKLLTDSDVQEAMAQYYEERKISWKYSMDNFASFQKSNNVVYNMDYIGGTDAYKWAGLRLGIKVSGPKKDEKGELLNTFPAGHWTALTLESPGKGIYHLSMDYQTRADATPAGEIYLIPGTFKDAASLKKAMTADNLLKTIKWNSTGFDMQDKQIDLGPVAMKQGEYTLVFKATEESKSAGSYFYLKKLTATHESIMPPPGPNEVIYDFDLQDKENGIYEERTALLDAVDDIASRYAKGEQNWKYHGKDNTLGDDIIGFAAMYGMYAFANEENWIAFKIKSPGAGLYTLTMNHGQGGNGGIGAVYMLPGDTKDIAAAMDHSNRVGKITFHNETGEAGMKDGAVTQLGTWNFQAGKEYIVVLEAYDNSPFKARFSYMWISQLIAKEGNHMKQQTQTKKINSVVVDEAPVVQFGIGMYGAVSQVNGQDYFYFPTEGKQMLVYNLEDMARVRKVTTPFTSSKGLCVDKDGMVWMVGDAQVLWRYDPYTNTGFETTNFKLNAGFDDTTTCFYCCADDDGNIYFGSYAKGYIGQYNPKTDKFKKITGGVLSDDCVYSSGLIVKDGYLYAGINGDRNKDGKVTAEVLKIDIKADKVVARLDISEQFGEDEVMVRGVGLAGDTLFVGGISMKAFVAVDINTMQLKDYGIEKQIAIGTTEEINGKVYMMISGVGIHEYDVEKDTLTAIKGIDSAVAGFRCGETNAVTLEHNPLFPGVSYITFGGTGIKIYNVERKIVYTPPLIDEEKDGSGQVIRTVIRGPEGSNQLYIGGFNTDTSAIYDITTGKTVSLFNTEGQTDTLMWYDGNLYAGNYPGAYITRVNLEDNDRNVIMQSFNNSHGQARIHALIAGDGMLFAGTIPDWYSYGGVLVAIDLETLERTIVEDIVPHQSVTGLVYRDGYVFGTTSLSGGSGADEPYNDEVSAVIFVYDVAKKQKVAELDLRDYFSHLPDRLPFVDGIAVDPNGQLWGVIAETVFTFDFNPTTKKFTVKKQLSFDDPTKTAVVGAEGRSWKMCDFDFYEGYMYVALGNRGGMRRINYNNPSDNSRINCEMPRNFVIGEDGNLYYALNSYELKMYPLNVTSEDWAAADKVDKMILAIKQPVTIEDEEQVQAALDAYEALSWKHKALVQNYEILEIAKTDLLEARIDTIGEVTLESEELIRELLSQYEALSDRQKKYVKNYQTLNAADLKLQELINAREAARVQKLLDEGIKALGEITLEDEEALKKLREAYDALTFLQRQLVDATELLDAEAIIYKLRQEIVQKLIQMIASIGEVTLEDEPVIVEALEIFEWLTLDERNQVDFTTLTTASKQLTVLQKAAAAEVDALILAIGGRVTYLSADPIKKAREAYDALTPGSQAYVKNIGILLQAEEIYNAMFPLGAIIAIVIVVVAGGTGAAWFILRKKKLQKAKVSAEVAEETPSQETEIQE